LLKAFLAAGLCFAATTTAFADFSYEQNTKITGGALAGMMKMAGAFSKAAREPITNTVIVKGDRMVHITSRTISITDLKSETITDVDLTRKTYSVITFADMAKAMQNMADKMASKGKQENADMNMKASIKETGQTKMVSGFNTKEVVLTIDMEITDQKSGNKGNMTVVSDMWIAPKIAGYDEVRDFYRRMSQKIAWTPGTSPMMAQNSEMVKGMSELMKESAKMDGMPILQIMKMGAAGDGSMPTSSNNTPKASSPPPPSASEAAAAAIAGRLGGFGGFGRKKKPAEEQQQTQPAASGDANASSDSGSGALMEMTMESSGFSTAPADPSKFEIPAGFKQVDSPRQKALR